MSYAGQSFHVILRKFILIILLQVTTCNELLSDDEIIQIKGELDLDGEVEACILQDFDTEFEFTRKTR